MEKSGGRRRRQGRPAGDGGGVGREALIEAAMRLLRDQPPSRVTMSSIAREAGADPALVRYYFGTRAALLTEIVVRLTHGRPGLRIADFPPLEALAQRVRTTFRFTGSARYMHRLLLEELAEADGARGLAKLRDLNRGLIGEYAAIKERDGGAELVDFDPLFLNLTILAASDFFHSALALIEQLAPDVPAGELAERYQAFFIALIRDGLRKR